MTDKEKLLKLDDIILELEIAQERARVMASDIGQEYFDLDDDMYKLYYFKQTDIKFDILQDYIVKVDDMLAEIRKNLRDWRKADAI